MIKKGSVVDTCRGSFTKRDFVKEGLSGFMRGLISRGPLCQRRVLQFDTCRALFQKKALLKEGYTVWYMRGLISRDTLR